MKKLSFQTSSSSHQLSKQMFNKTIQHQTFQILLKKMNASAQRTEHHSKSPLNKAAYSTTSHLQMPAREKWYLESWQRREDASRTHINANRCVQRPMTADCIKQLQWHTTHPQTHTQIKKEQERKNTSKDKKEPDPVTIFYPLNAMHNLHVGPWEKQNQPPPFCSAVKDQHKKEPNLPTHKMIKKWNQELKKKNKGENFQSDLFRSTDGSSFIVLTSCVGYEKYWQSLSTYMPTKGSKTKTASSEEKKGKNKKIVTLECRKAPSRTEWSA